MRCVKISFGLVFALVLFLFLGCCKKKEELKIEVKTVPAMKIAYVEKMGPYEQVGATFAQISEMAKQKNLKGKMLGVYLDDPTVVKPESCRSQLGIELLAGEEVDTSYKIMELPEQTVVFSIMKGPYEKIVLDYEKLFAFATSQGYQIAGSLIEIYWKSMGETTNPEEYETEVRIPVTK